MEELDYQKLRGGYYTPRPIAEFLSDWVIQDASDEILEPGCGDGALLETTASKLLDMGGDPENVANQVYGVELDPEEANKARERLGNLGLPEESLSVAVGDFFAHRKEHFQSDELFDIDLAATCRFDGVIGNPPFVRYQNFPVNSRSSAFEQMNKIGLNPNGHTNMWVPFVVLSTVLLKEEGRLGMVIPAELFQVKYAAETRRFLTDYFNRITIITFEQLVFDGVQQEVVLLLGEKGGVKHEGVRVIELRDETELKTYDHGDIGSVEVKPMDHSKEKWTQYFLDTEEIQFIRALQDRDDITISGDVYDVSVGVVTGNNSFFILNQQEVDELGISDSVRKIVTRSAHLNGAIFNSEDGVSNTENQRGTFLFLPEDKPVEELSSAAQKYIAEGEEANHHTGYKCRIRKRWYIVPSVWVPDAFMLRQVHSYPKLIVNESGATCTDTIHRVRFFEEWKENIPTVTAAFLNSLTFAFSEIRGRSYGGGVLTFEPSEAEELPLPLKGADNLDLEEIDALIRDDDVESVLDMNDQKLLIDGLGLSSDQVDMLRGIWTKLRDRRINRK